MAKNFSDKPAIKIQFITNSYTLYISGHCSYEKTDSEIIVECDSRKEGRIQHTLNRSADSSFVVSNINGTFSSYAFRKEVHKTVSTSSSSVAPIAVMSLIK